MKPARTAALGRNKLHTSEHKVNPCIADSGCSRSVEEVRPGCRTLNSGALENGESPGFTQGRAKNASRGEMGGTRAPRLALSLQVTRTGVEIQGPGLPGT